MITQSWIHLDREHNIIYINLNSEGGKIVKISPGVDPEMVENDLGLASNPSLSPFRYIPNVGEAEGFRALKALLMDSAPMQISQQYFLICWAISAFLLPYFPDRILLQMFGNAGSGKSQTMARLSMLFNGDVFYGQTIAAAGRMACVNPVLFMDNVDNLSAPVTDFLLFMANSAHKPKAKAGNDIGVSFQKLNALCMITSIEPFPVNYPELLNRSVALTTDRAAKKADYVAESVLKSIRCDRDLMLSAIFKLIGKKVLPRLKRENYFWKELIGQRYSGHGKERMNDHLAVMALILEALLEYLPYSPLAIAPTKMQAAILDQWFEDWNEESVEA